MESTSAVTFTRKRPAGGSHSSERVVKEANDSVETSQVGIPANRLLPDIAEGPILRLNAYRVTWEKCLRRIKELADQIQGHAVQKAVDAIGDSYTDVNPLLPFPEMPFVVLSGSDKLSITRVQQEVQHRTEAIESVVPLSECGTVQSMLKAVIAGFIASPDTPDQPKRKVLSTLAAYDINLLHSWWRAMVAKLEDLRLVVVLPPIEDLNTAVLDDVLSILASCIDEIRLTILTSASVQSTVRARLSHSTSTMLQPIYVPVQGGYAFVSNIIEQTLCDPHSDFELVFEGQALANVLSYAERYNPTLDGVVSYLQMTVLHHFSNPFTVLVHETSEELVADMKGSSRFVNALRVMSKAKKETEDEEMESDEVQSATEIAACIDRARNSMRIKALINRAWLSLFRCIQAWIQKVRAGTKDPLINSTLLDLCNAKMRDKVLDRMRLVMLGFDRGALEGLLETVCSYVSELPVEWYNHVEESFLETLLDLRDKMKDPQMYFAAVQDRIIVCIGGFLTNASHAPSYDDIGLRPIWLVVETDVALNVLNPSPHPTVLHGLLNSQRILSGFADKKNKGKVQPLDMELAFRAYMEAPRLLNVYDWYSNFKGRLKAQQASNANSNGGSGNVGKRSPVARRAKGKDAKKSQQTSADPDDEGKKAVEEEDPEWVKEAQARFLYAMHEMEWLGFIRGSGRKTDHVFRTSFDAS